MKCSKCGTTNPEGARFCNQCGAELLAVLRRRDRGQRRRVAILFSDISGFTTLSEKLDPEEVRDLINACLQRLAGVIYRYEGYIDKFIGDCIMALFGAPVTHEDDPLRAVIAALDQMAEIKEFNQEKELDLELSIGINYGLVATGDLGRPGEYTVMGDVVNLAQRLQYAAPRGRIYVSNAVYKQTSDEIAYKKIKPIRVKGKKDPVGVYEPQRVKRQFSLRRIQELPLVGRQNELTRLNQFFHQVKSGKGAVVSLIGDAGIGKSKLTYEFKKHIKDQAVVLEGRGIEYLHTTPYSVLKDIFKNVVKASAADRAEKGAQKVDAFIKGMRKNILVKIAPFLKYFLDFTLSRTDYSRFESMKPQDRMRLLNEALRMLLVSMSEQQVLVIVFEDCHWIDSETIHFMEQLATQVARRPIMILNLYRPEFRISDKTQNLEHYTEIRLTPLSLEDTTLLLQGLLHCKTVDEQLLKLLLKQSGRIPFYVHELAQNLMQNNVILVENGIARLKHGMETAVPRTLDELVMAKIDKLDSELRTIVDMASVIGDEFSISLLAVLLELGQRLKNDLALLVQKGILQMLQDEHTRTGKEERYIFGHSLMREAVYQSLLKQTRKEYHRQIGRVIELAYKENLVEYYDTLAQHFLIGGIKEKAVEYLEKAGDRKQELYLNNEAISLYEQCLASTGTSDRPRVARIYEKLGRIYELIGNYDQARKSYQVMAEQDKADDALKVRSYNAIANVHIAQGQFDDALTMLNSSRKALKRARNMVHQDMILAYADVLRHECWAYRMKGSFDVAEQRGLEAIALIKKEKNWRHYEQLKNKLEYGYNALAIVYSIKGEYEKAIQLYEDTLLIAEELGDRQTIGHAYNGLGTIYRAEGKFDQAVDAYMKKLKTSTELGDKRGVGAACCNLGNVYQDMGEFAKAIELLQKYLVITEELGDIFGIGQAHVNLGVVFWNKGEHERAIKSLEKYLAISEEIGDKRGIVIATGNLGEAYAERFEYRKAVLLLERSLDLARELGLKTAAANASCSLAHAYGEMGDIEKARRCIGAAHDFFMKGGNKRAIGNVCNVLARLALLQNDIKKALAYAENAVRCGEETNTREILVYALLNQASAYRKAKASQLQKKSDRTFKAALAQARKLANLKPFADVNFEYARLLSTGNKGDRNAARKHLQQAMTVYKEQKILNRVKEIEKLLKAR